MVRLALAAAFLLPGLPAHGQMLSVLFEAQAQMTTKAGNVTGCGFSFMAVHVDERGTTQGLSGSVNLLLPGVVPVKAGLFDFVSTGNLQSPVKQTPSPFRLSWARAGSGKIVSPEKPEHQISGEDEGFQLFAAPVEAGTDLLLRVATGGEKLWLGFRSKQGRERVFNGPLRWEEDGEAQFLQCLDALRGALAERSAGAAK